MQEVKYNIVQLRKLGENNYKLSILKRLATGQQDDFDKLNNKIEKKKHAAKLTNNISRAKNNVIELALCNKWQYFVTLTLDPKKYPRDNLPLFIKDLGQFIRDYRKKTGFKLQYLLIPELHKDKKNWHMHGLISEIPIFDIGLHPNISERKKGYVIWNSYNEKFGYCSLSAIRDNLKCCIYISKYINKDLSQSVRDRNKKLYYCSRGLKKSVKIIDCQMRNELKIDYPFKGQFSSSIFLTDDQLNQLLPFIEDSINL